jgi:hypothetical protein
MSGGDLLAPETMGIRKNFLVVRTILVYSYVGVATDVADEDSMPGSSTEMVADLCAFQLARCCQLPRGWCLRWREYRLSRCAAMVRTYCPTAVA